MWQAQLRAADAAVSALLPRYTRWTRTRSRASSRAHSEPLTLYLLSKTTDDKVVFKLGETSCPFERIDTLAARTEWPAGLPTPNVEEYVKQVTDAICEYLKDPVAAQLSPVVMWRLRDNTVKCVANVPVADETRLKLKEGELYSKDKREQHLKAAEVANVPALMRIPDAPGVVIADDLDWMYITRHMPYDAFRAELTGYMKDKPLLDFYDKCWKLMYRHSDTERLRTLPDHPKREVMATYTTLKEPGPSETNCSRSMAHPHRISAERTIKPMSFA